MSDGIRDPQCAWTSTSGPNTGFLKLWLDDDSGTRKAITRLPDRFKDLHDTAERLFQMPAGTPLSIKTIVPGSIEKSDIDPFNWEQVKSEIHSVWISLDTNSHVPQTSGGNYMKPFQVHIRTLTGKAIQLEVRSSSTVLELQQMVMDQSGVPPGQQRLIFSGKLLKNDQPLAESGVEADSVIHLVLALRKPVIYLSAPTTLNAVVDLELVPGWEFSAIYPVVPIKEKNKDVDDYEVVCQSVTWNVRVLPDGTLLNNDSGSFVSYLYWEAITKPSAHANATPPTSRSVSPTTDLFDPACLDINPSNSVLVPIGRIPKYLDSVLLVLGLHTEARTSFITYWLPDLLAHPHIALRFFPQKVYEKAAPLHVEPKPISMVRVFMLWKGVVAKDIRSWEQASGRFVEMNVGEWREIVGVPDSFNIDKQRREVAGLTVLEWGGMEIIG